MHRRNPVGNSFMRRFTTLALMCGLALTASPAVAAVAHFQVRLADIVFIPLNDGREESVDLTGQVNVVIRSDPGFSPEPTRINVLLAGGSGVGDVTGLLYVASGQNELDLPAFPSDPVQFRFVLLPVGGTITFPLDIAIRVVADASTGVVTGVTVERVSVFVAPG